MINRTRQLGTRWLAFPAVAVVLLSVAVGAPADAGGTPTCFGRAVTLMGTPGDDELQGRTGRVDVIMLGRGADLVRVVGEDGPSTDVGDYICGGPGADWVGGTAGNDHLAGGRGADRVDGWRGADLLQGNAGADLIIDDSIQSQDVKNDVLRGGIGPDVLLGGWGQDRLFGHIGADQLVDLECDGPTRLYGGEDNDTLESYQSSFEGENCRAGSTGDVVVGGDGDDTATVLTNDSETEVETVITRNYAG